MAIASPVELKLRAGPLAETDLAVWRVEGSEALSAPFRFLVEAWSADGAARDVEAALGGEAVLRLVRPGLEERVVHGEVHAAELAMVGAGSPLHRFTIRPRLARLGVGARSRVFQEKTVPEIVAAVLDGWKVKHRLALSGQYPRREMTLQHRESDLAFLSRLLEAEGIWYRFEHRADGHTLVLADGTGGYVRGGSVAYAHSDLGAGTGSVTRVERTARLVAGTAASRDYDFERPMLQVAGEARDGDGPEVYEWPGGYRAPGEGRRLARTRLEELRHGAESFEGRGTSLVPVPGTTFGLEGQPELLTVGVVHRAEQGRARGADAAPSIGRIHPEAIDDTVSLAAEAKAKAEASYESRFQAIAADRSYRPRRRTRWPRVAGIQTATVVVPAGEEVHTDKHERVKVRFRWDREGKQDDTASAWVRVAQPWAGAGMGAAFVPRIGQEVLIRFLDGDPDRPVVAGAVYNGQNVPPLELPHQRTRSTVRTASSPGGEGANELRFEDDAGREQVYLHAQRDRAVEVRAEEERVVRGSAAVTVEEDRTARVLGSQRLDVARDDTRAVGALETTTVALARTVTVAGSHDERVGAVQTVTVAGAQSLMVGAASAVTIGAAAALNVGGGYAVNVGGALNQLVVGVKSTEIGGAALEAVGAHREERVLGEKEASVGEGWDGMVHDDARLATDRDETWTVTGKATVSAGPGAAIEAASEVLEAQKLTVEVAGKPAIVVDAQGNVTFTAASLTLDGSELALKGSKVSKIQPQSAEKKATWVELELLDEDGKGVGNAKYELHLADGSVKKGALDGAGKARVEDLPPGACRVVFPDEEKRKR